MNRLALAFALTGCVVAADAGALTAGATDGSTSSSTGASDETSTTEANKLDIAALDVDAMECDSVMQTTMIEEAPSDIIVVVARTMSETDLDPTFRNFSQLIANDDIEDVRVVMLAGYPPDGICIDQPPLGTMQCPTNDDNPPMYRHFDTVIQPATLLQQVIDTNPLWQSAMRPEARKHVFVVSSRDSTLGATAFDTMFGELGPSFDNYVFHAMAPGSDDGDCSIVEPGEPWSAASEYAALAAQTGGVFENACDYNVDALFEALLDRIIEASLSCEYDIPPPPDGFIFEKGKVNVDYDDGFGEETVGWVETPADCVGVGNGWYYDDFVDPQKILMCPQTCARFEALREASIEIRFGCSTVPAG